MSDEQTQELPSDEQMQELPNGYRITLHASGCYYYAVGDHASATRQRTMIGCVVAAWRHRERTLTRDNDALRARVAELEATLAKREAVAFVPYTPEQLKEYYPVMCNKCGWRGLSIECSGGGAIADAGDYDDIYCPKCWDFEHGGTKSEPREVVIVSTPQPEYVEREAVAEVLRFPDSHLVRIDGVCKTVRVEWGKPGKEMLSPLVTFDGSMSDMFRAIEQAKDSVIGAIETNLANTAILSERHADYAILAASQQAAKGEGT
jgi:hypothetical protein